MGYRSWSLFLVCNPTWLLPEKAASLAHLYRWHQALGAATGQEHAAIWFYRQKESPEGEHVDVERSIRFCKRFELTPSQGPFVVLTTVHPEHWLKGDSILVLAFSDKTGSQISSMLSKLTDQVVSEQLSQDAIDSQAYWLAWIRVVEVACKWLDKVRFKISAKVLEVERTGACGETQ